MPAGPIGYPAAPLSLAVPRTGQPRGPVAPGVFRAIPANSHEVANMTGYVFIALTVLLSVYGQLVLKWQASLTGPLPEGMMPKLGFLGHMLLNPWVASGLAAAFAASLCWMLALKKLPLSTAYPFTSLSFVLILVCAVLFLDEPLTGPKVIGTALIMAGIVVMAAA